MKIWVLTFLRIKYIQIYNTLNLKIESNGTYVYGVDNLAVPTTKLLFENKNYNRNPD